MTKLQSTIVFVCSIICLVFSIAWLMEGPDYEPFILIIGGIGGIVASYWPWKARRRLSPEQKIAARERWRPIFDNYFLDRARNGNGHGDAIVHDVGRLDTYPSIDDGKGISSWFRCGLMGTYHRGVLLGLNWTYVVEDNGTIKQSNKGTEDDKVILVGAVPYESIESVNFDGDHYYNKPHIFCHFDFKGEPYERLFYAAQNRLNRGPYFYTEILEYQPPKKTWFSALKRKKK